MRAFFVSCVKCVCLLFSLGTFWFISAAEAQQSRSLITQAVDESRLTILKGNIHPLARPEFDLGTADGSLPMKRMLLVLKRSDEQESALRKLLDDQQDKNSPSYHKWLTPEKFGEQFGPSDSDMQTVTSWLQSHGFQVGATKGRTSVEFSGTAGQVQEAFHTTMHAYIVTGQKYWANASDPQIPAALARAVTGIASLNNFPRRSTSLLAGSFTRDNKSGIMQPLNPLFTFLPGYQCSANNYCYAVGPYDFATIYNVQPLWNAGINGTGETIAIVGESNINVQDVASFRSMFGLPVNNPNVILNGPDPGIQPDESEADIDVQWSGAVAPNATIDFVVSQSTETTHGTDLSAVYIVENNLAGVMSESYGECELGLGTAGNQFFSSLWQQAAAQGITVMVSSGDNGSAGCDAFDVQSPAPAVDGLQVSGYASTPYNVAVGGTDFNEITNPGQYWSTTNNSLTQASALGYIPETTWNDSCTNQFLNDFGYSTVAEANCNNANLIAYDVVPAGGSGGVSECTTPSGSSPSSCSGGYAKPSWQTGTGVPNDGKRDIPDVSLFASNGFSGSFYIFCESDQTNGSCDVNSPYTDFLGVGGTSVSSPAFAGIMALVNQQTGSRQGNANYILYKLAAQQPTAFHDVTVGTIAMPCATGSPNCVTNTGGDAYGVLSGYSTTTGYDLATGLGSVNANNLVTKWNSVTLLASTTTLSNLSPTTITHGQAVNFTVSVAPKSGSGTPSGQIALEGGPNTGNSGIAAFSLTNGSVSSSTEMLPGGTYSVTAHYPGDSTFGPSDSSPISVTVNKENSSPQVFLVTFDSNGNVVNGNTNTAVYGSPYVLRVNVNNAAGKLCSPVNGSGATACPTGDVTLTNNGSQLDAGTYVLNSYGFLEDQAVQLPGGSNSVQASYAGDNSFSSGQTVSNIVISKAPTTTSGLPGACGIVPCEAQLQVSIGTQSSGAAPTGTVTFFSNGTPIGQGIDYGVQGSYSPSGQAYMIATLNTGFTTPGVYQLTASYSGDLNYGPSSSPSPLIVTMQYQEPTVNVQSSSTTVDSGSTVTLTAEVVATASTPPTGTVSFDGGYGFSLPPPTYSSVVNPSTGFTDLVATETFKPAFGNTYNAHYSGDSNYPANDGSSSFINVNGSDFTLLVDSPSVTVKAGKSTTVGLFVGVQSSTVKFSSAPCQGLPTGAACSIDMTAINQESWPTVTVTTTARTARSETDNRRWIIVSGSGIGLASLVVILLPNRRKRLRGPVFGMMLLASILLGCGGGSTDSGGGGGGGVGVGGGPAPGTPAGTYPITITASSGSGSSAISHSVTFSLTVQ